MVLGLSVLASATSLTAHAQQRDTTVIATLNGESIFKWEAEDILARLSAEGNLKEKPVFANLKDEEKLALAKEVAITRLVNNEVRTSKLAQDNEVKTKLFAIEEELLRNEFLARKAKASMTPEKIKERYEQLVKVVDGKDELHIHHILLKTEAEAEAVAKELAAKPASFADIAKKKSLDPSKQNGGDMGYMLQETMVKEFNDAALALKKGQISKPVKTQLGWHIIKVGDRRPTTIMPFDTVKAKVEQELAQKIIQDYRKSLLDSAKVELATK